jgi:hypothetical protein
VTHPNQDKFVGRWMLESCVGTSPGKSSHPIGESPFGMLVYTEQYMMVFISSAYREKFSTNDIRAIPTEQIGRDFPNFETYCGRYTVDESQSTVTHFIENSKIPNHIGVEFRRHFRFDGSNLILRSSTELILDGEPWLFTLVWNRME